MPEPTFDADGYPTAETYDAIAAWPADDLRGLVEYVRRAWRYPDYWQQRETRDGLDVRVSTGGWSGNEDLIAALEGHPTFWLLCWHESRRGGHYRFVVPRGQGDAGAALEPAERIFNLESWFRDFASAPTLEGRRELLKEARKLFGLSAAYENIRQATAARIVAASEPKEGAET